MAKIRLYTRSGDDGLTYSPAAGTRIPKDHLLVELSGTVDEAISAIGLARSLLPRDLGDVDEELLKMQELLFSAATTLQTRGSRRLVGEEDVSWLEEVADKRMEDVELFVIPSGHPASAALHVARAVVRRLERVAVKAARSEGLGDALVLKLLNRLSDALFALAVHVNRRAGYSEDTYKPR